MSQKETSMNCIRSPICAVVGHVDHGKSSILDYIRNTNIVASEAGSITQAIGASVIPIDIIKEKCGALVKQMNLTFTIPGLLFIDTPGHAAFSSLRKRGGALADIAIVVVDVKEGFKPQTIESIKILRDAKTPFVLAVNKIDMITGYKSMKQTGATSILGNVAQQTPQYQQEFETNMYKIVEKMYEYEFPAERFDRVADFAKEVAMVPISAKVGDGMPELLMVLSALTQKFLEQKLHILTDGPAKGTILEVKEERGMGTVLDAIIYDGTLKVNDVIVIADLDEPIVAKIRGLFIPTTMNDMRDKKSRYGSVKSVCAATGVRICAPNIDRAKSGMPFAVCTDDNIVQVQEEIMKEIDSMQMELDERGIIVKADTIGSLEALVTLLKEEGVPVREANVGEISKKDIVELDANVETDPDHAILLGFNIKSVDKVPKGATIFTAPVIYQLIETYKEFSETRLKAKEDGEKASLPKVGSCTFLSGCAFRQSNPAVFGVEVNRGIITKNMLLMKSDGSRLNYVSNLQENNKDVPEIKTGGQAAMAMQGVTIERQINEGDVFYTQISENDFLKMKAKKHLLSEEQKELLKEIAVIMRKQNPVWGIEE